MALCPADSGCSSARRSSSSSSCASRTPPPDLAAQLVREMKKGQLGEYLAAYMRASVPEDEPDVDP
jgi:hypothetical protein